MWTIISGSLFLKLIDLTIGLRVPLGEEILGADIVEHSVSGIIYDKKTKQIIHISDSDVDTLNKANNNCLRLSKSPLKHRRQSHSLGYHLEDEETRSREITLFETMRNSEKKHKRRKTFYDICLLCMQKLPCACCSKSKNVIQNIEEKTLNLTPNKTMSVRNGNIPHKLTSANSSNHKITTVSERISQYSYVTYV